MSNMPMAQDVLDRWEGSWTFRANTSCVVVGRDRSLAPIYRLSRTGAQLPLIIASWLGGHLIRVTRRYSPTNIVTRGARLRFDFGDE